MPKSLITLLSNVILILNNEIKTEPEKDLVSNSSRLLSN